MISALYIEASLLNHPRVRAIRKRFSHLPCIECDNYTEVFNRKAQNFRLQKQAPALILAKKHSRFVLKAPNNYGLGSEDNYYFSHMLNCIYDCRYCFLQGMYRSAHYVLFINYEDYFSQIEAIAASVKRPHFFSGYDCDSLALEPVSAFVEHYLPIFRPHKHSLLELRTKSTQVRSLLNAEPFNHCVVAFSFTAQNVHNRMEYKVPLIEKRIEAMLKLQRHGWPIGLRFDPLIYYQGYSTQFQQLVDTLFQKIDAQSLHSVSLGVFRLPAPYFKNMQKLYPEEKLFAANLERRSKTVAYSQSLEREMIDTCRKILFEYIDESQFYPCSLGLQD